jgi:hypothetical protein
MINDYQIIEVSWEERFLRKRTHPQSVKITTPGLLEQMKSKLYESGKDSLYSYYESIPSILTKYTSPLSGELDYKTPLDFMDVYYYRPGMIACVSERVKRILEYVKVDSAEFILFPINLKNQADLFYLLFVPMIPITRANIDFSKSEYVDNHVGTKEAVIISSAEEYLCHQGDFKPQKIVLSSIAPKRNIYHIESCSHVFYSKKIVDCFINEKITGAKVIPYGEICTLEIAE